MGRQSIGSTGEWVARWCCSDEQKQSAPLCVERWAEQMCVAMCWSYYKSGYDGVGDDYDDDDEDEDDYDSDDEDDRVVPVRAGE